MESRYLDRTDDVIKQEMLDRTDDQTLKIAGTFINDSYGPISIKLAEVYMELDYLNQKRDINNLTGEELDMRVEQRTGIKRKQATKAIRKGIFSRADGGFFNVEIGDWFTGEALYYKVIRKISDGEFQLECEEPGEIGNGYMGALLPVSYIDGLAKAEITDILTPGYNAESDESLLARYYEKIRTPATSGNKYHYLQWAKEVTGVGNAKVISLWDGPGTVKVVIVDSNKKPATEELITSVYDYIEDNRPIGATVTVVSAKAKDINITVKVSLAEGYRIQLVQDEFKKALERYRKDIAFKDSYISYAAIGSILFTIDGILDYTDLKLNGAMKNIALKSEEIPIFDSMELEVI